MDLTINVIDKALGVITAVGTTITIDGNINTNSNNATETVADGTAIDIQVTRAGYHTYSNTINVYTTDETITILLAPEVTLISDPNYNRPYPYFFTITDPCSLYVDIYNASSFAGQVSLYINNTEVHEGSYYKYKGCQAGDIQIKQRSRTYTIPEPCVPASLMWDQQFATVGVGITGNTVASTIDTIDVYLALDLNTNYTLIDIRPELTFEVSNPNDLLQSACCYSIQETVLVTPSYTLNNPNGDDYTLRYVVRDPDGNIVSGIEGPFAVTNATDPNDVSISFLITKIGTYTIYAEFTDNTCELEYIVNLEIKTCGVIVTEYVDCDTYSLTNKATYDNEMIVNVVKHEDPTVVLLEDYSLGPLETVEIKFTEVGLYIVTVDYLDSEGESTTNQIILNNYCHIEDCLTNFVMEVFCDDGNEDCQCKNPCESELDFLKTYTLMWLYFSKLQNEYGFNNIYTALDIDKLNELTRIQQVLDKLVKYCDLKKCTGESDPIKNCGCK